MSTKPPGGPLLTLLSLFITLTAYAISGNAVAPLISTLSAPLGVPASSFGYIIALQYAVFALTSFGGGALKERLRLSNYHAVSAGLVILSALFFVGAAALRSALALVLWVIPLGIAGSSVETFASIEISRLSDPGSSKNLCLSQVFYTLGALAAPQVVYFILGAGLSWKAAFVLFGCFSIAVFAFFLLSSLLRGRFAAPAPPPAPSADAVRARGIMLAVMMVLMFVSMILESISGAWMAYLFELRHGLTARDASLVLVLYWVGMIASRLVILLLPARWTLWPAMAVSVSGVLAAAVCLAAHAVAARPARPGLPPGILHRADLAGDRDDEQHGLPVREAHLGGHRHGRRGLRAGPAAGFPHPEAGMGAAVLPGPRAARHSRRGSLPGRAAARDQDRPFYPLKRPRTRAAFWPPKPKELESATSIRASRACRGT